MLLITSLDTRRWVIPKGNPIRGLAAHEAAAREAFEEAGIDGIADPVPIGRYGYGKRRRNGRIRAALVEVFPLAVAGRHAVWPEQHQRDTRWFGIAEAAAAVDEPELKALIVRFGGMTGPSRGRRLLDWLAALLRWPVRRPA